MRYETMYSFPATKSMMTLGDVMVITDPATRALCLAHPIKVAVDETEADRRKRALLADIKRRVAQPEQDRLEAIAAVKVTLRMSDAAALGRKRAALTLLRQRLDRGGAA